MTHHDPLLDLLYREGDSSPAELARKLDRSEAEVKARIEAWERDGTIRGYQAVLDPVKARPEATIAMIEVKLRPERGGGFDRIASRIARFDEVRSCFLVSGGYDLQVVVEGPNLQAVAGFVSQKLATIDGVLSTGTHFFLKAYKQNGFLMIDDGQPERLPVTP